MTNKMATKRHFSALPFDILEGFIDYMNIDDIEAYMSAFLNTKISKQIRKYGAQIIDRYRIICKTREDERNTRYTSLVNSGNYRAIERVSLQSVGVRLCPIFNMHDIILMSALSLNEHRLVNQFYSGGFMKTPIHETLPYGHFINRMSEDYLYNFSVNAACIIIIDGGRVFFIKSKETSLILSSNEKTRIVNFRRFVKKFIKNN